MFNYKSKNRGWLDTFGKGGNLNKIGAPKYKSMQEAESDPNLNKPIYSGTPYNTNKDNSEVFQTGKNKGKVTGKGAIEESISPLDFIPALDAAAITMKGIGILGKEALNLGEKAIQNTWRLNPKAYQYNIPKDKMFRGLGKEGMEDALESGVFRAKQNVEPIMYNGFDMSKQFNGTYYTPKFETANKYGKGFIAEVPKDATSFRLRYKGKGNKTWSQIADENIPIEKGKILKKDWLKGYKEVPKPQQTFKSEINWGKWNKEIPENKALIQSSNELPPIPNQLFIDDVSTINLSRGSSKGKKQIFKKTETTNENGLDIKTRYRGDEKIPSDITVEGKSGYWQLRPNKSAGENTWYFSANMGNPLESGKAMLKINEKFPFPKPVILEPNNLSLDSYNNLLNMGKRKDWTSTFENYIPLNYSSKNSKILKDLNIENTPNTNIFKTKKEADEVVNRVNKFLSEKGVTHPARIFENKVTNTFGVEIPNFKLQRQYQNGGIIGNNGMFDMSNPNIYKSLIPAAIGLGAASQIDKKEFGGNIIKKNGGWLDKLN